MKQFLLLFLAISLISCQSDDMDFPEFSLEAADELSADTYEVYSVILDDYSNSQVVIKQQTSSTTPAKANFEVFFSLEKMANMESTLFDNYEIANGSSSLLDTKIEIASKEVQLISTNEYAYFFERENQKKAWSQFDKIYPESGSWYFVVNNIGFNEGNTQAIVGIESYWYMTFEYEATLSSGRLYYLEKNNGIWAVIGSTGYELN